MPQRELPRTATERRYRERITERPQRYIALPKERLPEEQCGLLLNHRTQAGSACTFSPLTCCTSKPAVLVASSHPQFSQIRGRQPYSIVRNIPYFIIREGYILKNHPPIVQSMRCQIALMIDQIKQRAA